MMPQLSMIFGYDAAYVHVVINHLPTFALLSAVVPLLVGLVVKSRAAVMSGLLLMMLAAGGTGFTMYTGEEAYLAIESDTGPLRLDVESYELLEIHEHRAEDWAKVAYVVGGLAAAAFLLIAITDRATRLIAVLGVLLCLGCAGMLGWIAQSGGVIVHEEFRDPVNVSALSDSEPAKAELPEDAAAEAKPEIGTEIDSDEP